jgi:gas vesicle protein
LGGVPTFPNGYIRVSESEFRKEKTVVDRDRSSRIERAAQGAQGAQAEWLGMLQTLAEQIQKQQQNSQQMIQEMMDTYMQLLNTPGSYLAGQAEQQQRTFQQTVQQWMEQAQQQQQTFQQQAQQQQQAFQQMTQEVLSTYTQLFNIPLSYAQEGLRSAQFPMEGYDELTVEEVSGRLGDLSAEELRVVRDYEEPNKNRDTILEQLDRRIRGGS